MFFWDAEKKVYLDGEGKEVSAAQLRRWIDDIAAALVVLFMRRAAALRLASLDVETDVESFRSAVRLFDLEMRADITAAHILAAALAFGGISNAKAIEYETGEAAARFQLGFWDALLAGLASGTIAFDESFVARVGMYGAAFFSTYENAVRARETSAGKTEERRFLGNADHCKTCPAEAAKGWQPIGTLRAIGDSECLSRCRCHFKFR